MQQINVQYRATGATLERIPATRRQREYPHLVIVPARPSMQQRKGDQDGRLPFRPKLNS